MCDISPICDMCRASASEKPKSSSHVAPLHASYGRREMVLMTKRKEMTAVVMGEALYIQPDPEQPPEYRLAKCANACVPSRHCLAKM